jgi:hypothetical protein
MKFILLFLAGSLLIIGYIIQSPILTLSGSGLYLLSQIVNLLLIVRMEGLSRKGKFHEKPFRSNIALLNQLSTFCELIIFFFSAISFLFFPTWFPRDLWLGSAIVIFGQFFIWFISGLIGRCIKYLPIKMGFSSWYIQHKG